MDERKKIFAYSTRVRMKKKKKNLDIIDRWAGFCWCEKMRANR